MQLKPVLKYWFENLIVKLLSSCEVVVKEKFMIHFSLLSFMFTLLFASSISAWRGWWYRSFIASRTLSLSFKGCKVLCLSMQERWKTARRGKLSMRNHINISLYSSINRRQFIALSIYLRRLLEIYAAPPPRWQWKAFKQTHFHDHEKFMSNDRKCLSPSSKVVITVLVL